MGRPHGVDGKVRIYLHNPESTAFLNTQRIFLEYGQGPVPRTVSGLRMSSKSLVGYIEACCSRTDAESLKGARVFVSRDDLPCLEEDEFYVADLMGLEAWDGESHFGEVVASRCQGGIEVVTVRGEDFEMDIPLVDDFVERLEIPLGRIRFHDTGELPRNSAKRKPMTRGTRKEHS